MSGNMSVSEANAGNRMPKKKKTPGQVLGERGFGWLFNQKSAKEKAAKAKGAKIKDTLNREDQLQKRMREAGI